MTHVLLTLRPDGSVGGGLGRAPLVAVATVDDAAIVDWQEHPVGWDVAHDEGTEGAHHARIVRFLKEHQIDVVATGGCGPGMARMLGTMGIRLVTGVEGDAGATAVAAATAR